MHQIALFSLIHALSLKLVLGISWQSRLIDLILSGPRDRCSHLNSRHLFFLFLWFLWVSRNGNLDVHRRTVGLLDHGRGRSRDLVHGNLPRYLIGNLSAVLIRLVHRILLVFLFLVYFLDTLTLRKESLCVDIYIVLMNKISAIELNFIWIVVAHHESIGLDGVTKPKEEYQCERQLLFHFIVIY